MATSTYDPRTGMALPPGYGLPYNPFDNNTWTAATAPAGGGSLPATYGTKAPAVTSKAGAKAAAKAGVKAVFQATAPSSTAQTITRLYGNRPSWTPVQSFGIIGGGSSGTTIDKGPPVGSVTYPGGYYGGGSGGSGQLNPMVDNQARIMGGYTDAATNEMRMKQSGAESLLRSQLAKLAGDPQWQAARTMAMQAAQNPGINPALLAQMRGRAAASAAANTAAGARSIMAQIARGNIRGAGAANAMQMNNNRGAVAASQQTVGIDQWAAEKEQANKAQALQQLVSILQGQNASENGLTGQLASTMTGYNPLSWLSQINGIMSPVGALGQAAGLRGIA